MREPLWHHNLIHRTYIASRPLVSESSHSNPNKILHHGNIPHSQVTIATTQSTNIWHLFYATYHYITLQGCTTLYSISKTMCHPCTDLYSLAISHIKMKSLLLQITQSQNDPQWFIDQMAPNVGGRVSKITSFSWIHHLHLFLWQIHHIHQTSLCTPQLAIYTVKN